MYKEKVELKYGDGLIVFDEEPDIEQFESNDNLENTLELKNLSKDEFLEQTSIDLFGGDNNE